ncbi:TonB-dependent receptor [Rugosibacter aromaticivorans]|uniref:TonB-dependent receptor n=1 Tax=Rugosibacter aromaticivorans TaxID=1565605 RepID=A0A0C5JAE4_9PROT|nr:TonB-dependent siderophore receptor [Rugosibacter aromaticivorans]AJP48634.1 TonB-dependent receptor [Rugosibacter aromaticivorans]
MNQLTKNTSSIYKKKPSPQLLPLSAMILAGLTSSHVVNAQEIANGTEKQLPTVTVQAEADKPDGYRATTTRVGKILQDPHDIPQAVTTITQTLMEEQQVGSLREALRNVSGLTFNAAEGGRSGDNMNLRGFYTFGDMYLDGIRDTAQYNRETFNYEQIDVLRGAGAMLFGRGQAGGVINQVSKTPLNEEQYKLTGSIGENDYKEVTADLNKPLNENTAVRINLMQRDEGSWRSNPATGSEPEIHRKGIGISLGFNLYTNNQFWLNHYQLKTEDNPDYGMPFDTATRSITKNFSPDTFWGTDSTFDKSDTKITTLINEYRFSPDSQLRTQVRIADYERSYWARTPSATQAPNAQALVLNGVTANGGPTRTADYETVTLQSDYSTKFTAMGMKHELLTGVEYLKENSYRHSLRNLGGTTAANPPYYQPYDPSPTGTPVRFDSDSYAVYVQDTIEFIPKWKATLGMRRDEMDANFSSATSPNLYYGQNSYRSALSFHPTSQTHYYLSWSDSFSPTADLYQLTVSPLPPERSDVIELGAKWLLFDGDLALRAALYQATKKWERNGDLESTAAILTKKRRTKGFELEAAGRITNSWEIFSGLALMDARILEVAENVNPTTGIITMANPGYVGQRARNTPSYTANLWTTYKLDGYWKVGGGIEAKGERLGYNPSGAGAIPTLPGSTTFHPNTLSSYTRWDAMVAYEREKWTLRLNVRNVFDKIYYDSFYENGGFATPGTRRAAILTGEIKF